MRKIKEKIIIFAVIISIVLSLGIFAPKPTFAMVPVFDPTHTAVSTAGWAEDLVLWLKDDLLKALRDAVVKRIMDSMADQTIKWIKGEGEPQFVTDFKGFLKDSASAAVGDVVLQTNAAFICSPFKAQIMLGLLPVPKFGEQVKCTVENMGINLNNFYKDFSKGGWIGYTEVMKPEGNYYGVALQISANLNAQSAKAVDAASKEAQAGSGFLSVKRCKGGGLKGADMAMVYDTSGYVKDSKGNYCLSNQMENITPGDTVGEAVKTAINSDSQWAANVQSYTAALINALINRLIMEGLSAMSDSNSSSANSAAGYTGQYQGSINQNLKGDQKLMIDGITQFLNEWQFLSTEYGKALAFNSQVVSALQEIKELSCIIFNDPEIENDNILEVLNATSTDVALAKSNTAQINLTKKVSDLGLMIQQANGAIIQINVVYSKYTASSTTTSTVIDTVQLSQAQGVYLGFMNNYNNRQYLEPLTTGSDRTDAAFEVGDKANKARLAQQALGFCGNRNASSTQTN